MSAKLYWEWWIKGKTTDASVYNWKNQYEPPFSDGDVMQMLSLLVQYTVS